MVAMQAGFVLGAERVPRLGVAVMLVPSQCSPPVTCCPPPVLFGGVCPLDLAAVASRLDGRARGGGGGAVFFLPVLVACAGTSSAASLVGLVFVVVGMVVLWWRWWRGGKSVVGGGERVFQQQHDVTAAAAAVVAAITLRRRTTMQRLQARMRHVHHTLFLWPCWLGPPIVLAPHCLGCGVDE